MCLRARRVLLKETVIVMIFILNINKYTKKKMLKKIRTEFQISHYEFHP